jgi:hypothetical protein
MNCVGARIAKRPPALTSYAAVDTNNVHTTLKRVGHRRASINRLPTNLQNVAHLDNAAAEIGAVIAEQARVLLDPLVWVTTMAP